MNNLIKFSIFTPTYNGEKFIKSCIDSVLNQNLTEFEWYIYDDGSTDSTYDVLKKLVLNDRRVHLSRGDNGNSIERMNDFWIMPRVNTLHLSIMMTSGMIKIFKFYIF